MKESKESKKNLWSVEGLQALLNEHGSPEAISAVAACPQALEELSAEKYDEAPSLAEVLKRISDLNETLIRLSRQKAEREEDAADRSEQKAEREEERLEQRELRKSILALAKMAIQVAPVVGAKVFEMACAKGAAEIDVTKATAENIRAQASRPQQS